jgi:hypothetical protein
MVGKLGKVRTHPVHATRLRGQPDLPYGVAIATVMHAMACCYPVQHDYPVFGALISTYARLGSGANRRVNPNKIIDRWEHKVHMVRTSGNDAVDPIEAAGAMALRYGCTTTDVMQLDALIRSVTAAPAVVSHWLLTAMMVVDYGGDPPEALE